jgi:hypothetical protein
LGAAVVALQALHSAKHRWTICFLTIALLFDPAIPVFPLANTLDLVAIVLAAAAFAVSLTKLKSLPLLSIPSITDRNPGSESLVHLDRAVAAFRKRLGRHLSGVRSAASMARVWADA